MAVSTRPSAVVLGCADPRALAEFYRNVTRGEITHSDGDSVCLGDGPLQLAFQRIDGYRAQQWPESPAHAHLDFTVADLAAAEEELLVLGATKPDFQPGEGQWTVLIDPEGHPFCISAA
ncbi:VOC family protein [Streptomyces hoynatensis]|uniref:VOC family protein n=1 Tax=Streptomyces hoynatensis TaxID=1141874 RepID=A0A3A9YTD0_9ACTN|nr:VOC family protein [Streptomyces hoynatensis]RKN39288.1 VOC family protein [Streptomyces hoynatensis]